MYSPYLQQKHYGRYRCNIEFSQKATPKTLDHGDVDLMELWVHETGDNNPCHDEWIYFDLDDVCISIFLSEKNWTDAREFCQEYHGADLTIIKSDVYNTFMRSMCRDEL
ncbi:hypothetical protein PoB_001836200 [Plakobranchus ocellatus]|uniref:C-type lectin domain-containing protein n=1 Tax=Plakobranchus ocellatus TaxID=259542 RepID=A0AAV3ZBJ7_9GAST|nr:hypothetical protein PoB_001836200 [Plakobranchus ocellatus]